MPDEIVVVVVVTFVVVVVGAAVDELVGGCVVELDGGTEVAGADVVDVAEVVVGTAVVVGAAVVVVGADVDATPPTSNSGEMKYPDDTYVNPGNTGPREYAYNPFPAPDTDAGDRMQPDADTSERPANQFVEYPYAPFG